MPSNLIRYQHSGQLHFVTFSCYRRLPLLETEGAYATFEHELEKTRQRYDFVIAGYVLMPEHAPPLSQDW
jgi:putative transposase